MLEITRREFLTALRNYHPAVHSEIYIAAHEWWDEDDPDVRYYAADGCVIIYQGYELHGKYNIWCYILEADDGCDFAAACRKCLALSEKDTAAHETWSRDFELFHCGELSDKMNEFFGFRKFTRMGERFPADPHVLELTRDDMDSIKELCAPAALENDTWFGKREAEDFYDWSFDYSEKNGVHLLGYYDNGKLLGIASWSSIDDLTLGFLQDLFVSPDARGKGVGKALVRTAISNLPDREWLYQAARDNERSIGLAKSLGFTFAGAGLYVLSDKMESNFRGEKTF